MERAADSWLHGLAGRKNAIRTSASGSLVIEGSQWSVPVEVANGIQPDGKRLPCWNPVLFQPTGGPLVLFYKVGPSPDTWWGLARTSTDEGRTWSAVIKLPDGILGPIRAKPIELSKGTMLAGSSTENDGWIVHMERYSGDWTAASLASSHVMAKDGAAEHRRRIRRDPTNDPRPLPIDAPDPLPDATV